MTMTGSNQGPSILVSQLPPSNPAALSKTLDAVARVNFEKDTFHYVQSNRRTWMLWSFIFAGLAFLVTTFWLYREWNWMQERSQLQRKIYESMIDGSKGVVDPASFR